MVRITGNMATNAGVAICSGTAIYFPTSLNATETTSACACGAISDTTNSSGVFQCLAAAANKYDIRVNCGSAFRWVRYADEVQHATYQTGDGCACGLEGNYYLGLANDAGLRWSLADASNHALVLGVGDTSQQFHITDAAAMNTDWARSAGTHPELAIHSNTTPATDYLSIGNHDGATATVDVVGGTTLALDIAGNTELTVTASGLNVPAGSDILFTGTTGTNDINLVDSVADALSIVRGCTDFMVFDTSTPRLTVTPATTITGDLTLSGALTVAGAFTFNDASADVDFRFEGANNANLITGDGGTDSLAFGSAVVAGAFMDIEPGAQDRDMVTAVGIAINLEADSTQINAAGNCATIAVGASIHLGAQTYTSTATALTVTDLSTLHIVGEPVDSTNVTGTRKYSALIETGSLGLGIPGGSGATLKFGGSTSGIVTIQTAAVAGTYSLTLPVDDGTACQFLQTNGCGVTSWATSASGSTASVTVKETTETRCTCTTLTDDSTLKFAVAANEDWGFWAMVHVDETGGTSGDLKISFTGPTNATVTWGGQGAATCITDPGNGSNFNVQGNTAGGTARLYGASAASNAMTIIVGGAVVGGACSGCLNLQWAQAVSTCQCTNVLAGSMLVGVRK